MFVKKLIFDYKEVHNKLIRIKRNLYLNKNKKNVVIKIMLYLNVNGINSKSLLQ